MERRSTKRKAKNQEAWTNCTNHFFVFRARSTKPREERKVLPCFAKEVLFDIVENVRQSYYLQISYFRNCVTFVLLYEARDSFVHHYKENGLITDAETSAGC